MLQKIKLTKDCLIHIEGLPFRLKKGTCIFGLKDNFELAIQLRKETKKRRTQI